MGILTVDGVLLRKMIISGANELTANKQIIDSLNVFPVPDGDTGTNMSLTVRAAAKEVSRLKTSNVSQVANVASNGSLRGARGNSGVILSQIFRGFAKGLEGKQVMLAKDLAGAFTKSAEIAYKAVMRPKEGTILTVGRALSTRAAECSLHSDDIEEILNEALTHGKEVLERTVKMLPALRQANVVDAGGKGLICFVEGMCKALNIEGDVVLKESATEPSRPVQFDMPKASGAFGYCTEFLINAKNANSDDEDKLKHFLKDIGDSIMVVADQQLIKVHVHTQNPGRVLEFALKIGSLDNIKIDNMAMQHNNMLSFGVAFVAVAAGAGFVKLFSDLGASEIIEGGQTMNPSTHDILAAIEKTGQRTVVVLPNNKNIVLAAKQAANLCKDRDVHVLPTKTIPQGLTALVHYEPSRSLEENLREMESAMSGVKTGQVTYAAKNSVINNREIKKGDILCMTEDIIAVVSDDVNRGTKDLLDIMLQNCDEDKELVSIYYGEAISEEQAQEICKYVEEKHPHFEAEVHSGQQPLYYYFIAVE